MLDDPTTIRMTNLTQSLKEGGWNIEYWRGYGFTANNRTTTNGSLSFLLRCVHTPENQAAVMQFAREVAKTDRDAARQVARIDAAQADSQPLRVCAWPMHPSCRPSSAATPMHPAS